MRLVRFGKRVIVVLLQLLRETDFHCFVNIAAGWVIELSASGLDGDESLHPVYNASSVIGTAEHRCYLLKRNVISFATSPGN